MTDDPVEQALAELQDLVRCRCHPAYTGRGLHDPGCECDSAEAVKMVADHIEAQAAEIERLRDALAKAVEAAYREGFLAGTADGWVNNPRIKVEWKRSKALAELKGDKP